MIPVRQPPGTARKAPPLDLKRSVVNIRQKLVVVLTQYSHAVEQGYQFNLSGIPLNYPDNCTARNNCPGASGTPVPSFGHLGLVERVAQLVDAR